MRKKISIMLVLVLCLVMNSVVTFAAEDVSTSEPPTSDNVIVVDFEEQTVLEQVNLLVVSVMEPVLSAEYRITAEIILFSCGMFLEKILTAKSLGTPICIID